MLSLLTGKGRKQQPPHSQLDIALFQRVERQVQLNEKDYLQWRDIVSQESWGAYDKTRQEAVALASYFAGRYRTAVRALSVQARHLLPGEAKLNWVKRQVRVLDKQQELWHLRVTALHPDTGPDVQELAVKSANYYEGCYDMACILQPFFRANQAAA